MMLSVESDAATAGAAAGASPWGLDAKTQAVTRERRGGQEKVWREVEVWKGGVAGVEGVEK